MEDESLASFLGFPAFSRATRRPVTLSSVAAASRHICAASCRIEAIDSLPGADVVEILDLADVRRSRWNVSSIKLTPCTQNSLVNVEGIEQFVNLQHLVLLGNRIASLSSLAALCALPNLANLNVCGNPVASSLLTTSTLITLSLFSLCTAALCLIMAHLGSRGSTRSMA